LMRPVERANPEVYDPNRLRSAVIPAARHLW